ncbi:hypothetical protein HPG69_011893 [Diceros bicornis minor]|uniref:Uncharacterized protein n=1 Tax=Diceros bicornis minor TaxID=77932 RepID=A0A7J7ERZ7_DICBM|nr:hypothetical protein HPG69_011893 [Diceros bicornis minor]
MHGSVGLRLLLFRCAGSACSLLSLSRLQERPPSPLLQVRSAQGGDKQLPDPGPFPGWRELRAGPLWSPGLRVPGAVFTHREQQARAGSPECPHLREHYSGVQASYRRNRKPLPSTAAPHSPQSKYVLPPSGPPGGPVQRQPVLSWAPLPTCCWVTYPPCSGVRERALEQLQGWSLLCTSLVKPGRSLPALRAQTWALTCWSEIGLFSGEPTEVAFFDSPKVRRQNQFSVSVTESEKSIQRCFYSSVAFQFSFHFKFTRKFLEFCLEKLLLIIFPADNSSEHSEQGPACLSQLLNSVADFAIADRGLKTYLIAGQRAKESHCSCSEALLSGFEVIDGSRVSSGPRGQGTASPGSVSDLAQTVKTFDTLKKVKRILEITMKGNIAYI